MTLNFYRGRMCLIWFLFAVVIVLVVMISYQRRQNQQLPPQALRINFGADDRIAEAQNGARIVAAPVGKKNDIMQVAKPEPEKPQAPPVQQTAISVEELTAELTRRRAQTSTNKVIVYDKPCAPTGVGACTDAKCQKPLNYSPKETVERLVKSPETTLSEEQQKAITDLGKDIPDSDLIIASAVSSNHFDEMQAMFESLHKTVYPLLEGRIQATKKDPNTLKQQNKVGLESFTVVLFDIGLTQAERVRTEKNCRCKVVTFSTEKFPSFVQQKNCYSWKPLIVSAVSQHAQKVIVWQDSSVRWFPNIFLDNVDRAYNAGHQVLLYENSHRIPANTLKETFDYFHEDACGYLPYPEVQGNLHMHRADTFNRQVLFTPWARCALEKQCMCPRDPPSVLACNKGTLHRCHRFDQSAMGLLLSRIYQKDLYKMMLQEFVFDSEKGFRVSRGSVNRNYFKS